MKKPLSAAALLLSALLLCSCGGKPTPPQSYDVEGGTLPSLTELVTLEDVQFETSAGEEGEETYVYSKLSSGGESVKSYTEALESEYECTIATDKDTPGAPDFSAESGQALVGKPLEDSEQILLLTIEWEETSCSITPSLADADALPKQEDQSITLEEAVELLQRSSPDFLGLPGSSMDEYLIYPQEGTVYLDEHLGLLLNVYSAADHRFQGSYILTVPNMDIYLLDRETGQAELLS